jgi:hypothetical protein
MAISARLIYRLIIFALLIVKAIFSPPDFPAIPYNTSERYDAKECLFARTFDTPNRFISHDRCLLPRQYLCKLPPVQYTQSSALYCDLANIAKSFFVFLFFLIKLLSTNLKGFFSTSNCRNSDFPNIRETKKAPLTRFPP